MRAPRRDRSPTGDAAAPTARRAGDTASFMSAPSKPRARPFGSLYGHGFVRVAASAPRVRPAQPAFNAERTLEHARRASDAHAGLVIFPELGLSAYTNEDLFHQRALGEAVTEALALVVSESEGITPLIVVGAPLWIERGLFNTAVVIHRGQVLGVVPKSYLPEYREYYEKRQFRAARELFGDELELLGEWVPCWAAVVSSAWYLTDYAAHAEICEDLWAPIPPSTYGALAGA